MSLLLDALNRASKDKAAAAAAQAAASPQIDEPAMGASASAAASSQAHSKTPTDAVADLPVLELSLASAVRAPAAADSWQSEHAVAAPDQLAQPLMASFVLTEPIQPAQPTDSSPAPAAPPAPQPPPQPDTVSTNKASASGAPRVAQEIVRAKAPAARAKPPLRLVVLGSLAVLLAAGLGSVLMGWWGDPVNWIQSAGLASPSTVGPAAPMVASRVEPASVSPVVSDVPVVSDAPNRPQVPKGATLASATGATRKPPDSVVSPAPTQAVAKPSTPPKAATALVQSRTVGPSPLELGYAALVEGRLPAAAQAYGQALLANPEERDALLGLAYIAHQQGRIEEARGYYQRVLRQDPGNAIARSGLLTTNAVDDPQLVASRSREVAEQNPDSAAAHSALGHAMVREGRLAEAQQAFFRAHSLEPGVALHAFNLAVALDRLRNFGPARQYYERALALSAQSGGERPSGVPKAAVQTRLDQLRAAMVVNPAGAARE
ncbi:MAG: tetratricopeptide repeat protein [Rhodoferax sp.]|nr:tetratricopeptide repeat protein [Rhodoferax sp.]